MEKKAVDAFWDAAEKFDKRLKKQPFLSMRAEELQKGNVEIKRTINSLEGILKETSTKNALNKQEYAHLSKAKTALLKLLSQRQDEIERKNNAAAKKVELAERGAKWIAVALGEVTTEVKVKIILGHNLRASLWNTDDINYQFERLLKEYGATLKTQADATRLVNKINNSLGDTAHPNYASFLKRYNEVMMELEK